MDTKAISNHKLCTKNLKTIIKKTRVIMLIPDKIYVRARKVVGNEQGHFLLIKWTISQEDITI